MLKNYFWSGKLKRYFYDACCCGFKLAFPKQAFSGGSTFSQLMEEGMGSRKSIYLDELGWYMYLL